MSADYNKPWATLNTSVHSKSSPHMMYDSQLAGFETASVYREKPFFCYKKAHTGHQKKGSTMPVRVE